MNDERDLTLTEPSEVIVWGNGCVGAARTWLWLEPLPGGSLRVTIDISGPGRREVRQAGLDPHAASRLVGDLVARLADDPPPDEDDTWPNHDSASGSVYVTLRLARGLRDESMLQPSEKLRRVSAWALDFAAGLGVARDPGLHPLGEAW